MFNPGDVRFKITERFGRPCLVAEYGFYASTLVEIDPSDTLESLEAEMPELIDDIRKQFEEYCNE